MSLSENRYTVMYNVQKWSMNRSLVLKQQLNSF